MDRNEEFRLDFHRHKIVLNEFIKVINLVKPCAYMGDIPMTLFELGNNMQIMLQTHPYLKTDEYKSYKVKADRLIVLSVKLISTGEYTAEDETERIALSKELSL